MTEHIGAPWNNDAMQNEVIEIMDCLDPDNGDVFYHYAKGHIDPATFATAVGERYGFDADPADVRQTYLRYGMSSRVGNLDFEIFEYDQPGRGRFKATIYDI